MAALLAHASGSGCISGERRFDPRQPAAADRRVSSGGHCLAIRRANGGGWPASKRRPPADGPAAAGSPEGQQRIDVATVTIANVAPVDRRDRLAVVITEIAVTIAIVVVVGSAVTAATAAITAIAAEAKESHRDSGASDSDN